MLWFDSATMLAENAAHAFGEWLDDMNHPIWEIAIEIWNIENE